MKALTLPLLATLVLSFVAAWGALSWKKHDQFGAGGDPAATISIRPVAEFEPTFGIGISEQVLTKKDGMAFMKALLASGTRVYLFIPGDKREAIDKLLRNAPNLHGYERDNIVKIQLEHESMWARDYFPIPILKKIPHVVPTPSFVDFVYRDGNTLDDAAIHQMALAINLSVDHLPLVLDGGNFLTNGEKCILSEEVSEDPEILLLNSPEPPLESNIGKIFQAALGCQKTILVSQIPHPHVDMWMKFLNKNVLAVNQIDLKSIDTVPGLSAPEREKARKIARELDKTADMLEDDFEVIRMPMPVPTENLLLTYSNAVLSNGKAIVPRYSKDLKLFKEETPETLRAWQSTLVAMEKTVVSIYSKYGFEVTEVDSNEWIRDGGSFHCVTFHLPDLDAIGKNEEISHDASRHDPEMGQR
ncbi:MAG: agmatine deiminase family protein [Bdellovibrionota bacterium]